MTIALRSKSEVVVSKPLPLVWCGDNLNDARRLRILRAASNEFMRRGLESANLDEIAASACVGKATIYKFFHGKSDLLVQCVLNAAMEVVAPLCEILEVDQPVDVILRRVTRMHITRMVHPVLGNRPFYEMVRTLIGASINDPKLAADCRDIFADHLGKPLMTFFAARIERGELKGDAGFLSERFMQGVFFTNSVILNPDSAPRPDEIGDLARRTVDLFLYGCHASC
jgi:AcrR family transcriptional regulator